MAKRKSSETADDGKDLELRVRELEERVGKLIDNVNEFVEQIHRVPCCLYEKPEKRARSGGRRRSPRKR